MAELKFRPDGWNRFVVEDGGFGFSLINTERKEVTIYRKRYGAFYFTLSELEQIIAKMKEGEKE